MKAGDFPGGAVDSNLPASAGDMRSSPDPGTFHTLWSSWAHELQPRSLRATATEACRTCVLHQEKPPQREALEPQGRLVPGPWN